MINKRFKKTGKLLTIIIVSAFLLSAVCDNLKDMYHMSVPKFKDFKIIQKHIVYLKESNDIEHMTIPMSFNRGIKYRFHIQESTGNQSKLRLTVYGNEKKTDRLGSSFVSSLKKDYPTFEFVSKTTSIGCLDIYYEGGLTGCSIVVTGFNEN